MTNKMEPDVDVRVVGAGACGLAAAIAAHGAGASVAMIEKLDRPGGNSSLSTGSVPAAGTRFQREAGIADSTERFVADLLRTGGQSAFTSDTLDDPAIARLRQAVRLQPYTPIAPWPKDRPGRVSWRLSNGEVWSETVENARGGADRPFSTDELLDKIDELTRAAFPAMSGVLRGLITDPYAVATTPWRDVVAQMTRR